MFSNIERSVSKPGFLLAPIILTFQEDKKRAEEDAARELEEEKKRKEREDRLKRREESRGDSFQG